jgi:hypothetical protein
MFKNFKIYLMLVFVLFACGDAVKIHQKLEKSHLIDEKTVEVMKSIFTRFTPLLRSFQHFADSSAAPAFDQNGPMGAMMKWVMSDSKILGSIMAGKPLTQASANKVKKYMKEHP